MIPKPSIHVFVQNQVRARVQLLFRNDQQRSLDSWICSYPDLQFYS